MDSLTNLGIIERGTPSQDASLPRTFLITGLGRSGTTMVATIFAALGLLRRSNAYEATLDDREFLHLLSFRDQDGLVDAVARRNDRDPVWAFKIPSLHGYLEPPDVGMFRNPHLVVIMRDLVATAQRHAIAEYVDPAAALFEAAQGQADLLGFAARLDCPTLFISYEKSVIHPNAVVRAVAHFAGVAIDTDRESAIAALIKPDNRAYARSAIRRFEGRVDGVFHGRLVGWCRDAEAPAPLSLDLLIDGIPACTTVADVFREDLRDAGIGDGRHGFSIDLTPFGVAPDAVLTVRVTGRTFIVPSTGKPPPVPECPVFPVA